jgi:hypothetical protein
MGYNFEYKFFLLFINLDWVITNYLCFNKSVSYYS